MATSKLDALVVENKTQKIITQSILLYPYLVSFNVLFILEDTSSKPVKDEHSCPGELVATTQSGSGAALSNSSGVKSRPPLKKLTIPLKALSSLAPHHKVLPGKQPISAAIPRWVKKQPQNIVIQSGCGSIFCHKLKNQIAFLQWKIIYSECCRKLL